MSHAPGASSTPARFPYFWLVIAAVALPRLALLPFNENVYGDAIPRTEMAERWMANPHLITAFGDGTGQYGPLHIYLVGLMTLIADREMAGRLLSLVCGVLTVFPLYTLGRYVSGWQAGVVACLGLSVWGLHLQFSTTAASESLALLLMLSGCAAFAAALKNGSSGSLIRAAVWLTLAEAVRYDAWMYPPVLAAVTISTPERRVTKSQLAVFLGICMLYPALWLLGNYQWHGDPTTPLDYINEEHRRWAATFQGFWGSVWLRVQGVGFWPAMTLASLTPGVAALATLGMVTAWRERRRVRWVIVAAVVPVLYFTVRTTVFGDFVPLTRFMAMSLALMLLFVWDGYVAAVRTWGSRRMRTIVRASIAMAVLIPVGSAALTFRRDGVIANAIRPVSPTSTNPRAVMSAAAFVRSTVLPAGSGLVVDIDERFLDLPLVFYGGMLEEDTIRIHQLGDLARVERERPEYAIRFDRGRLVAQGAARLVGRTLEVGGTVYDELDGFAAPVHVYRRRPNPSLGP